MVGSLTQRAPINEPVCIPVLSSLAWVLDSSSFSRTPRISLLSPAMASNGGGEFEVEVEDILGFKAGKTSQAILSIIHRCNLSRHFSRYDIRRRSSHIQGSSDRSCRDSGARGLPGTGFSTGVGSDGSGGRWCEGVNDGDEPTGRWSMSEGLNALIRSHLDSAEFLGCSSSEGCSLSDHRTTTCW